MSKPHTSKVIEATQDLICHNLHFLDSNLRKDGIGGSAADFAEVSINRLADALAQPPADIDDCVERMSLDQVRSTIDAIIAKCEPIKSVWATEAQRFLQSAHGVLGNLEDDLAGFDPEDDVRQFSAKEFIGAAVILGQ